MKRAARKIINSNGYWKLRGTFEKYDPFGYKEMHLSEKKLFPTYVYMRFSFYYLS